MNEIKHHGTQGMSWGNWRSRSAKYAHGILGKLKFGKKRTSHKSTPASKAKPKSETSDNKQTDTKPKITKTEPTNQELRDKIERIKLEQEYKRLTEPQKQAKSKGRQYVENVLYDSAASVAKRGLIKAGNYGVDKLLDYAGIKDPIKKDKKDKKD